LQRLLTYPDRVRLAALLLPLLGLGSCDNGPTTACITPQATCKFDGTYSGAGIHCHCGNYEGVVVTR
jgi:hypothetical protein